MQNLILVLFIIIIIISALWYILHAKKSGDRCIGCPHSKSCNSGCDAEDK